MTGTFLITPPLELIENWRSQAPAQFSLLRETFIATRAAQWGSDQELEACCEVLARELICDGKHVATDLRAVRRPKPPRLKEQALAALDVLEDKLLGPTIEEDLIRRALETLDD